MNSLFSLQQVAPAELEDLLRGHSKIADVAVIGVPHEKFGEVPRAYIVRDEASLKEEEVHEYVNNAVAEFKRLAGGIEFIDAVPKSASGKILRKNLIEQYKNENHWNICENWFYHELENAMYNYNDCAQ